MKGKRTAQMRALPWLYIMLVFLCVMSVANHFALQSLQASVEHLDSRVTDLQNSTSSESDELKSDVADVQSKVDSIEGELP